MTIGIYKLNFTSNRFYIGQSNNIERRFSTHCRKLETNSHVNNLVTNEFVNYGKPTLEILNICAVDELNVKEIKAFELYKPILNIAPPAGAFPVNSGETNANARYSNQEIIDAIKFIHENLDLPLKEIALYTDIHYSTLKNISNGTSHHWLKDTIPNIYMDVLAYKGKRSINTSKNKNIIRPTLISPEGVEFENISNVAKFSRLYGLNQGALIQLLLGKAKNHHGWTIK